MLGKDRQVWRWLLAGAAAVLLAGCPQPQRQAAETTELEALRTEVKQLRLDAARLRMRNQRLVEEVSALRGFGPERAEALVAPTTVRLGRFTRGLDTTGDQVDNGVRVSVVVLDADGESIKAAGTAEICLFDLTAEEAARELTCRRYDLAETRQRWLSGFGTNYFRFDVAWEPDRRPRHRHVTVVVRWTDALTGANLEAQGVVEIRLPEAPDEAH